MSKRLTKEEFINKAILIHGTQYNYESVVYTYSRTKVDICCSIHGIFQQTPNDHLNGGGCPKCGVVKSANAKRFTFDYFVNTSKDTHKKLWGREYIYTDTVFTGTESYVEIKCAQHNTTFKQRAAHHMRGETGCKQCRYETINPHTGKNCGKQKLTQEEFITKVLLIHPTYTFQYSLYIKSAEKITATCPKHGNFLITPNNLLRGKGCPNCRRSINEEKIAVLLDTLSISYIQQKTFDGCKYKYKLPFDFYLPDYNVCVEYDGIQHHHPVNYFGGVEKFKVTQSKDIIKNHYCMTHNIKLIRIPYWEDTETYLKSQLELHI